MEITIDYEKYREEKLDISPIEIFEAKMRIEWDFIRNHGTKKLQAKKGLERFSLSGLNDPIQL